jgi:hypothetical protein
MRLRWRAEPWGPHPVNAMDFGGKFPEGTVDLIYDAEHDETSGAIQLWAPDDHVREEPETFRVVLLDPTTREPLAETIGVYDPETGMRSHHPLPESLDMRDRLVMTVEDASEQAARH